MIGFLHKLVFDLLIALLCVAAWRTLTHTQSGKKCLQSLPFPLNPLVQWYVLLMVAFCMIFGESFGNIVASNIIKEKWLDEAIIEDKLDELVSSGAITEERRADIALPGWLRSLSLCSPFAGGLAFIIVNIHMLMIIRKGYKHKSEQGSEEEKANPWLMQGRQEMLFLVVGMPSVFICMSLRSTSRLWMIMTGFHTGADAITDTALFKENFELAAVCQYYVVFIFARLCMSFLYEQNASEEIKHALSTVGFQGVYAWCIVGTVHSVVLFGLAYSHNFDMSPSQVEKVQAWELKVGFGASLMSLMCTYNMLMICRLKVINNGLPKASIKFNGTKILLLLGPNQLKVLISLVSSPVPMVAAWDMSEERAMILHSTLMCFECLLVVVVNFIAWELIGAGDQLFKNEPENYKPLVEA